LEPKFKPLTSIDILDTGAVVARHLSLEGRLAAVRFPYGSYKIYVAIWMQS